MTCEAMFSFMNFVIVAKPSIALEWWFSKKWQLSIGRFNESEKLAKYGYKLDMKIK